MLSYLIMQYLLYDEIEIHTMFTLVMAARNKTF